MKPRARLPAAFVSWLALSLVACATSHGAARAPLATPHITRIDGANFQVDASVPGPACVHGTPCTLRLHLRATGDYHVNESYPFGFVGAEATAVTYADRGAFVHEGAREGTLTVRFTPARAGTVPVAGVFRLCVCSDERCQIDTANVALDVTTL